MFTTLRNAWKVPELKKKILFTVFILMIFRLGSVVGVPYVNTEVLREYFSLCGGDYMEGELDLLDRTTVELRKLTEELESSLPGRIRVAYTLGLALGVGLFLLLI